MFSFHSKNNKLCWCGSGLPFKECHGHPAKLVKKGRVAPMRKVQKDLARPDYASNGLPKRSLPATFIEPAENYEKVKAACHLARRVLLATCERVAVGVTTESLDTFAHQMITENGAYPSPLNYHRYPKSICTSVNEVVCHGIPDDRPLQNGDIVNVDVTVFLDGVHGDCNATVAVGDVDDVKRALMQDTWQSLMEGIKVVKDGVPVNEIGRAIENYLKPKGYGVVYSFCGHGIGSVFHTGLQVSHVFDRHNKQVLRKGMVLTIEPMVNLGTADVSIWKDDWTAVTKDLFPSAQYEHTLIVTEDGCEVLTLLPEESLTCPVE